MNTVSTEVPSVNTPFPYIKGAENEFFRRTLWCDVYLKKCSVSVAAATSAARAAVAAYDAQFPEQPAPTPLPMTI